MKKKMTIPEINELGNVLTSEEMKNIVAGKSCQPGSCICKMTLKGGSIFETSPVDTIMSGKECQSACKKMCDGNHYCKSTTYVFSPTCTPGSCECGSNPESCDCGSASGSCD